jgi:hypothetical protein
MDMLDFGGATPPSTEKSTLAQPQEHLPTTRARCT